MDFRDALIKYFPVIKYLSNKQLAIAITQHYHFSEVLLFILALLGLSICFIFYALLYVLRTFIHFIYLCLDKVIYSLMRPYSDILTESIIQNINNKEF